MVSRQPKNKRTVGDYQVARPRRPRKKQTRKFGPYNRSQEEEYRHFKALLAHLAFTLGQPDQTLGRPQIRLSDILFASVLKVYLRFSARKMNSVLELAERDGLIERAPKWPTVSKYLADPGMNEIYKQYVTISALPCRQVETIFAVDASGVGTGMYRSWHDEKYGHTMGGTKEWVKVHIMIGTHTGVIVSADVSEGTVHDTKRFPELVGKAAQEFTLEEIVADKGYISNRNLKLVDDLGAIPFIPFKKSYVVPVNTTDTAWNRMIRWYVFERDDFDEHYTKPRNQVEGVFSVNKRVMGPALFAKALPGQFNELYCRAIAHNLVRLIRVWYTLGAVTDVADFGIHEPVYVDGGPITQLSQQGTNGVKGNAPKCGCSVCQGTADPFWTIPGQTVEHSPHSTYRNGAVRTGTGGPAPDNIIYLFGKPTPIN